MVKNWPANAGDIRDVGSIPGFDEVSSIHGRVHGNPLLYSCPENPIYSRAFSQWVAKSQMQLSN